SAGRAHVKDASTLEWPGQTGNGPSPLGTGASLGVWITAGNSGDDTSVVVPDAASPASSYAKTDATLGFLQPDYCRRARGGGGCSEQFVGTAGFSCITPSCNALHEEAIVEAVFKSPGSIGGLTLP